MSGLNAITLPKYTPGYGMMPGNGPYGEVFGTSSNSDPYNTDFFGYNVRSLFPANPPKFDTPSTKSFGLTKKRRTRKIKKSKKIVSVKKTKRKVQKRS